MTITKLNARKLHRAILFLSLITLFFFVSCNNNSVEINSSDNDYFMTEYGKNYTDAGLFAIQTSDSGFVITGLTSTYPVGQQGLLVIKTNKFGVPQWASSYGTDSTETGYSILETTNHEYVICGYTSLAGEEDHDILFMRISNSGELLWSRIIGGADYDYGTDILELPDGSLILHGYSYSYGSGADDLFLAKFTAEGDSLWTKIYGGKLNEHGYSVDHTSDNGFIMTGFTKSFNHNFYKDSSVSSQIIKNENYYDVYVIKTDSVGDTLWTRTVGKANHDRGQYVVETNDGGYVIAGHSLSFENGSDILLLKLTQQGELLWSKTYSNPFTDAAYSLALMRDGGFLIAGETEYQNDTIQNLAGLLIRTNSRGDTLGTKAIPSGGGITTLYYAGEKFKGGYYAIGKTIRDQGKPFGVVLLSLNAEGNYYNYTLPSAQVVVQNVSLDIHNTSTIVGSGLDYKEHQMRQINVDCTWGYFKSEQDSSSTPWGMFFR